MKQNKIVSMLLALVVSVGLWLYVVTVVDPNDTKTVYGVPVTYDNLEYLEENNLLMTAGQNSTVNLKFYGRRSELTNLTNSSVTVLADVSRIKNEGEQNLTYDVILPDSVSGSNVQKTDQNPNYLTVSVERAVEIEVPVDVDIVNEVAEGYVADLENLTVEPGKLVLFGPAAQVEQVAMAGVTLDIANVTETVDNSFPYKLLDAEGNEVAVSDVTCSAEAVEVTLPVKKYKDLPLQLEILEGGGARESNVAVNLSPEYVTISGPAAVVDDMDTLVVGTLDLAAVTSDYSTISYQVTMPTGITNVSGETQVSAQIILSGLEDKVLDIESFNLLNEPEDLTVTVKTTALQIVVRGTPEDIEAITARDLTVSVDLADFNQTGTYTIPVTVSSRAYPSVGMIGTASITVTIE